MNFFGQFLSLSLSALLIAAPICAEAGPAMQIKVLDQDNDSGFTVQVTDAAGAPVSDAAVVVRMPETGPSGLFSDGTRSAVGYTDQSGRAAVTGIRWGSEAGTSDVRITVTRGTSHGGILLQHVVVAAASPASAPPVTPKTEVPPPAEPAPVGTAKLLLPQPAVDASIPKVSVINAPTHEKIHGGGSSKKWLIITLLVVGAGAGAGIAMAGKKSTSSATSTSTGVSIGSPTVTVGNP